MDRRKTGNKNYQIKSVSDHQLEIIRRLALGQSPSAIASSLGITRQTVSNVRNHPIAKEMIQALHNKRNANAADIARQIAEVAPKAIELLRNTIDFGNDPSGAVPVDVPSVGDQVRAAMGVLRVITPQLHLHSHAVSSEFIKRIKERVLSPKEAEVVG